MSLHIGKPYIQSDDTTEKSRLCADIDIDGTVKTLYYEVEKEYAQYLTTERSDAFLLSLAQFAMAHKHDVTWETPVTERLAYQVRTYFIPVVSRRFGSLFSPITISGPLTSEELEKSVRRGGVGTGVSGGVDSFYAILKHIDNPEVSQRVTHLFYVAMSNHTASEDVLRGEFETWGRTVAAIARDLNLPLVKLYCNEAEFFFPGIVNWYAYRYVGMVYALQKLWSAYYFASSYSFEDITFGIDSEDFDSGKFDLFSLMTVSTRNLTITSSGGEISRAGKTRFIERNGVVQKRLQVCNYRLDSNCSTCDKCMRTMTQLYFDGCLDDFSEVFDLDKFYAQKNRYLRKMLYRASPFDREILSSVKDGSRIPLGAKVRAAMIKPIYGLWQNLKRSKAVMNLVYKTGFDYRLYGKDMAKAIRYSKGVAAKK